MKNCSFGDLSDSLVRDQIVTGILNDKVRESLLRENELTLEKTINICRAAEASKSQVESLPSCYGATANVNQASGARPKTVAHVGKQQYSHRKSQREESR